MIIYGAGGHGKVVYDSLISQGVKLVGVIDDNPSINSFLGLLVINSYSPDEFVNEKLIISIGSNKIRYELSHLVKHKFGTTVHDTAFLAEGVNTNDGAMILAKSVIQPEVQIGKHSIINTGAIVEHDCLLGDFTHIGPGAVVCGGVRIGIGTFIGANATILPGISIGDWVTIGAGSVVLKDVMDHTELVGNPARIISK